MIAGLYTPCIGTTRALDTPDHPRGSRLLPGADVDLGAKAPVARERDHVAPILAGKDDLPAIQSDLSLAEALIPGGEAVHDRLEEGLPEPLAVGTSDRLPTCGGRGRSNHWGDRSRPTHTQPLEDQLEDCAP